MSTSKSRHRKPGRYSMGIKPRIVAGFRARRRQLAVTAAGALAVVTLAACAPVATEVPGPAAVTATKSASEKAQDKADTEKGLPKEIKLTKGQRRAKEKATDYLSFMAFSKKGLSNQLVQGDGFARADADYAVAHLDVDWNAQAAQKAKEYLDLMSFSRAGLADQLVQGDHFTRKQAEHGVRVAY